MPPQNSSSSFFVKHWMLLACVTAIFLLAIPAMWLYFEIKTKSGKGSPNIESQSPEQFEVPLIQTITERFSTAVTDPTAVKKTMQALLPTPSKTEEKQATEVIRTARLSKTLITDQQKLLQLLPPPISSK